MPARGIKGSIYQNSPYLKSGYIQTTLANGIGRFVPQCQRLVLKFCLEYGGSRGVRDFIQHDVVEFARANPATVIYLKPRRHRSPVLVAEYLNGERAWLPMQNMKREQVFKFIQMYQTSAGYGPMHYKQYQTSLNPSIQGFWTPFTNKPFDRNLLKYPQDSLSLPPNLKPSTTEIVEKLFGEKMKAEQQLETRQN